MSGANYGLHRQMFSCKSIGLNITVWLGKRPIHINDVVIHWCIGCVIFIFNCHQSLLVIYVCIVHVSHTINYALIMSAMHV